MNAAIVASKPELLGILEAENAMRWRTTAVRWPTEAQLDQWAAELRQQNR